eukprot:2622521-Prymnesium_polylepis.1
MLGVCGLPDELAQKLPVALAVLRLVIRGQDQRLVADSRVNCLECLCLLEDRTSWHQHRSGQLVRVGGGHCHQGELFILRALDDE